MAEIENESDSSSSDRVRRKKQKRRDTIHLNIQLTYLEDKLLTEFTQNTYGAKTLLVRSLLRKFLREQGLLTVPAPSGGSDEQKG